VVSQSAAPDYPPGKINAVGINVDPNNGAVYLADAALAAVPHSLHRELLRVDCNNIEYRCVGLSESEVPNIQAGMCENTRAGNICKVSACKQGYTLRNPAFSLATCTIKGWNVGRDLACVKGPKICKPLTDIDVANVKSGSCPKTVFGKSCQVVCTPGFHLQSPSKNMVSCTEGGYWHVPHNVACVRASTSTTTQTGQVNNQPTKKGGVTTAGIVVLVLAILAGVAGTVVALYCVLRIRKIQSNDATTQKMRGNLLDQDGETFDGHEI